MESKKTETRSVPKSPELVDVDLILPRIMTSERHSTRWGIRESKESFWRVLISFSAENSKRKRLLRVCIHLLNFQTSFYGLKHIQTVLVTEITINLHGRDF